MSRSPSSPPSPSPAGVVAGRAPSLPSARVGEHEARGAIDPATRRFRDVLEATVGRPFTAGNLVEPLRNGVEIFPAMLDAIRGAAEHVEFLTFIYWQGAIAREFADALAERARSGVAVRVLIDAFGGARMAPELIDWMRDSGCDVRFFRPLRKRDLGRLTNRTHRKVLVVDGRVGFTGGVGIAEQWEGDARNPEEWRETHFRVEGPAVRGLSGAFLQNWAEADGFALVCDGAPASADPRGDALIQVLRSAGDVHWNEIKLATLAAFSLAERRISITTAYFVPDEELVRALEQALARGVEVVVMMPGEHSDARLCNFAGKKEYAELVDRGATILQYQRTMLHCKITLVDDGLAIVGSPNLNHRSMQRDDEVALVVLDAGLVARLERDFEADRESTTRFDPETWRDRSPFDRAKELCARRLRRSL